MLPDGERPPPGGIVVEHLWKRFHADKSMRGLRDHLAFRRRTVTGNKWRWVLSDVNLRLEPGESVGLIGSNGSGKSTLLKILSGVMYPYAGRYTVAGRVGALLEVRAGLHGDLTGRENIYLYGGLLGLSRADVAARFDDILEFSALEDAIDRQLKYYSSGMGMRLGFSVAAFLEPDILLVDEALAVGDSFFQQRCLDRMRELLRRGTSLVLVSHDLAVIESVCDRGIWLNDGVVRSDTDVRTALGHYRDWNEDAYHAWIDESAGDSFFRPGSIEIVKTEVSGPGGGFPRSQAPMRIEVVLDSPKAVEGRLCLGVTEGTASPIFVVNQDVTLQPGRNTLGCSLPFLPLPAGKYYLWVDFSGDDADLRVPWQPNGPFAVEGKDLQRTPVGVMRASAVQIDADWDTPDGPVRGP